MTRSTFDRVRDITADVLHLPASAITPQSSPENIEAWDSVQHLNLVLALEQEFGVQLEPEEIDEMNSVQRIVDIIGAKISSPA
ncbi:MAG: acyl carrier protein [Acidobacteriales bacterium]|nr:acyl carrier protein [Terriglobales bacterium]